MRAGRRLCLGFFAGYVASAVLFWIYALVVDPDLRANDPHQLLVIIFAFGTVIGASGLFGGAITLWWLWRRRARLRWWAGPALGAVMTGVYWPLGIVLLGMMVRVPPLFLSWQDVLNAVPFLLWGAVSGSIGWLAAFGTRAQVNLRNDPEQHDQASAGPDVQRS